MRERTSSDIADKYGEFTNPICIMANTKHLLKMHFGTLLKKPGCIQLPRRGKHEVIRCQDDKSIMVASEHFALYFTACRWNLPNGHHPLKIKDKESDWACWCCLTNMS
jgi:urease accessory protein UreE